jgi:transketolase
MRRTFIETTQSLIEKDTRVALLLGDIGVFGFRHVIEKYPSRVFNIGILEQSTVSLASGMSAEGFFPIIHTIAPFLVERAYEQIKIDFCYQKLGGNFVSVGASYDYAALGCTHHCPGDIDILKNLPGMELIIPGTAKEFSKLLSLLYNSEKPTYFRLSEIENSTTFDIVPFKANLIKHGTKATVIAVGPLLDTVLEAALDLDVSILYYHSLRPFDHRTLKDCAVSNKFLLCEPYYQGYLQSLVNETFQGEFLRIDSIGVPREFQTNYGHVQTHNSNLGLTAKNIRSRIEDLIRV